MSWSESEKERERGERKGEGGEGEGECSGSVELADWQSTINYINEVSPFLTQTDVLPSL